MQSRVSTPFDPWSALPGCFLLALLLPACSSYQTNIKAESPNSDTYSPRQLESPRAPAVVVRAKVSREHIEKQSEGVGEDMDKLTLDRTIEQLRESGLFSDVWTQSGGSMPTEAVKLTVKMHWQWDQHNGVNIPKALISGFLLALPAPFLNYDEDLSGQMSLEAMTREGESKRYTSHAEGTATFLVLGQGDAQQALAEKIRAHLVNAILNQMARDEKLYALRPGEEAPATTSKRLPLQPISPATEPSPSPPPPPIY